jgi:hypothetical protein
MLQIHESYASVIAGLDPAIHLLAKTMDPRVKPRVTSRELPDRKSTESARRR